MLVPNDAVFEIELPDEAATNALAARLASVSGCGDVLALIGDLGTGKTTFARGFIHSFCAGEEEVPSPTFTLVQTYDGGAVPVYHFDLYRVETPDEIIELGIEDAFTNGVTLIEWPERLGTLLPADRLDVALIQGAGPDTRWARLEGRGYWRARFSDGLGEGGIHG